jgi:hypothetical protein
VDAAFRKFAGEFDLLSMLKKSLSGYLVNACEKL